MSLFTNAAAQFKSIIVQGEESKEFKGGEVDPGGFDSPALGSNHTRSIKLFLVSMGSSGAGKLWAEISGDIGQQGMALS